MQATTELTIVTLDADFAELAALLGPRPKVVWLHCGNQPSFFVEALLRRHAEAIDAFEQDATVACLEIY
jgi:predicted nuclease of predicted toxin-antitoxin system